MGEAAAAPAFGQARAITANPATDAAYGSAVALDGQTAIIGAPGDVSGALATGVVYVFDNNAGLWANSPKPASSSGDGDKYGAAVALSAGTLVVGAPGRNSNAGDAFVYTRNPNKSWTPAVSLAGRATTPPAATDTFGTAVAVSGNTILVGATKTGGTKAGEVYVFVFDGTNWNQQGAKLTAPNNPGNSMFGSALALAGNTAVVGAPDLAGTGAVYTFERSGTTWTGTALGTSPGMGSRYGVSVAISGTWIVVGALHTVVGTTPDAGAALFFERPGGLPTTAWQFRTRLDSSQPTDTGEFGADVAIEGDTAVIGSTIENFERGQLYVATRTGTSWQLEASHATTATSSTGTFGSQLALSGGLVVAGASGEGAQGAAYSFTLGAFVPRTPVLGFGGAAALAALVGACGAVALARGARRRA